MGFPRIATATLGVAVATWLAVALLAAGGPAARVELPVRDAILRRLAARPAPNVVAVAIDDESLRQLGPWPWERTRLAELVGLIAQSGPRAVAIDILLSDPRPGDEALARALAAAPAVLAAAPALDRDAWAVPAPALARGAVLAHATFELDHDGVMRRLVTTKQAGGRALPAFALAAVERAGTARAVPVGRTLRPSFRVPVAAVPAVSASRILAGQDLERLRGKIVVVGVTALGLGDRVVTPTSRRSVADPGALVHAATIECILDGELLRQASPAVSALLAALLAVLALQLRRLGGRRHVAAVSLLVVAPPFLAATSLALLRWELPLVSLTAVTAGTILLVELRLFLSMDAGTGKAARLLAADLGEAGSPRPVSPSSMQSSAPSSPSRMTSSRSTGAASSNGSAPGRLSFSTSVLPRSTAPVTSPGRVRCRSASFPNASPSFPATVRSSRTAAARIACSPSRPSRSFARVAFGPRAWPTDRRTGAPSAYRSKPLTTQPEPDCHG